MWSSQLENLRGVRDSFLADGSMVSLDAYRVGVEWDDRVRVVPALAAEGGPLVGMSLLRGSEIRIEAVDRRRSRDPSVTLIAVQRHRIRSEEKGFGWDVIGLIRAKNDYKHDRGPSGLQETMRASDEVQEMLRRCMEALAFFADYPIREEKRSSADPGDESRKGRLFLDVGSGDRIPLYPFIVSRTCPHCNAGETYFIDA